MKRIKNGNKVTAAEVQNVVDAIQSASGKETPKEKKPQATKPPLICSICGQDILADPVTGWSQGNSAWPITTGRCCRDCNNLVITRRINDLQRSKWIVTE